MTKKHLPSLFLSLIFFLFTSLFLTSCDSSEVIVNDINEREANEIIVLLASKGIDSQKVTGTGKDPQWNISVPSSKRITALDILNRKGLPRKKGQNLLEIIASSGGLVPSESQEEIKFREGKAKQIENTILKMDGVIDASVEISFPKDDTLNPQEKPPPPTASVYIKHLGDINPNAHLETKVKKLVSSSINGLDFDHVTVVTDQAQFADTPNSHHLSKQKAPKEYVKIWSIILATESKGRFQLVFFAFCFFIASILSILAWVLYKFIPLLHQHEKGLKDIFSGKELSLDSQKEDQEETDADAKEKQGEDEDGQDDESEEDEDNEAEEEDEEDEEESPTENP